MATEAVGIENWLVNVPVFDLRENLLGVPDLLDRVSGYVIESDGADHRRIKRHNNDNVREEVFEDDGMPVVRIGAAQHSRAERTRTLQRIVNGRARATKGGATLWTTRKPSWWWPWPPGRRWD